MEYKRIIAITGLSGLFELITSKADGAVVRSLEDKTTRFVSSRVHNFSNLESIEIFKVTDNVNLADVFLSMKKSSEKLPDAKAEGKDLQAYFQKIVPEIDLERVYASDMKKIVKWYGILTENKVDIIPPVLEDEEQEEKPVEEVEAEKPVTEEPVVDQTKGEKPAPKKKAAKKSDQD